MNKRIAVVTATTCMLFVSVMIPAVSAEGTTDIGAQNQVKGAADVFLEIITQPFLGSDGIVPDSSNRVIA